MKPDLIYDHIERLLNSYGFNIVTKVKAVAYKKQIKTSRKLDGLLKDAESIILVGFAGKEFWEILQIYLEENPGFKIRSEDWIDEYTKLRFRSVAGFLDENKSKYDMVFPFGPTAFQLDFMKLGKLAGVGVDSLLGVLINLAYILLRDGHEGRSLGKRWRKLCVISLETRKPCTWYDCFLRNIFLAVPFLGYIAVVGEIYLALQNKELRRYGDQFANTMVIVDPSLEPHDLQDEKLEE